MTAWSPAPRCPPRPRRCAAKRSARAPAPRSWTASSKSFSGPIPRVYDGRFANNGWLQEFPKPVTKLTWDNAAFISPRDKQRLGITENTGEMLKLTYQGRSLNAPVFVQPGHGRGRDRRAPGLRPHARRARRHGMGFNPYGLRTANALWQDTGLDAQKIGGNHEFAATQDYHTLDADSLDRHIIHHGDAGRVQEESGVACTKAPKLRRAN